MSEKSLPDSDFTSNKKLDDNIRKSHIKDDGKKIKAVALLSGGLDSQIAVKMMKEQNIEIEAVAIKTPFCDFDCGKGCGHKVLEVASDMDIKLKTVYLGSEYLTMLKNPKYGYGSGMNPCIDCRVMMYEEAKKHMETIGADFIVTGEVLHQRPMSQNSNALNIIEKESNLSGKVLRPLSAQLLPETLPVAEGKVDITQLGSIRGRSRKEQLRLASQLGIIDPPNSAGGCLLTDPQFAKRIKDLFQFISKPSINDVELLKIGRHFRISDSSKLIVGRNQQENEILLSMASDSDYLLEPVDIPGPLSLLRINEKPDLRKHKKLLMFSIGITLRYSDTEIQTLYTVKIIHRKTKLKKMVNSKPLNPNEIDKLRI